MRRILYLADTLDNRGEKMSRYFEWLFPVLKYIRIQREVSLCRAAVSALSVVVVPAITCLGLDIYNAIANMSPGNPFSQNLRYSLAFNLLAHIRTIVGFSVFIAILSSIELPVACYLLWRRRWRWPMFVLAAPQRPPFFRAACKFTALGCQTWLILCYLFITLVNLLSRLPSGYAGEVLLLVAACVGIPILIAVLAFEIFSAVIAVHKSLACRKCGYLLIGLALPRCPECGTPFDPNKLAQLTVHVGESPGEITS